ncbi:DoxX family protein [Streptomyces sp. WAC05374]|uniref:DoxX family protein n=1 Tax=Streptomyces sp. WAC05374 TaxID=2487420 RepID=UPI0010542DD1|nr:DoxX family protein [Streptomyces sp. WAC05374]TDF48399.1 DoxX family protein [Streptomyces sp. WAC05374]TDF55045.1 DoxX family protein [Streptomyces sp. WAC05374]TDF55333.1 DoxX family protein [Streptomyces sp. WAC05374]
MTAPAAPATTTPVLSRRADIGVWVLQIVLALFFAIPSAAPKLVGHSSAAEAFDTIGFGDWFMYLVGALELAGAIALVVPVLSGVSALALIGLMAGALLAQLVFLGAEYWFTPVIFALLLAVVARHRRHHTARLLELLRAAR